MEKNSYDILKTLNGTITDNVGIIFNGVYSRIPSQYRIYFDENGELNYCIGFEPLSKIRKDIKHKIDMRKLAMNCMNNDGFDMYCQSYNDWIIFGVQPMVPPLMIQCFLLSDSEVTTQHLDVICDKSDIDKVMEVLKTCVEKHDGKDTYEFGIATPDASGIYTNWYEYTETEINIEDNYNDDFLPAYEKLCEMIEEEEKTGLALLYGEPGTGKSSIIKHLIMKYPETDFVFMDESILNSNNAPQDRLIGYFLDSKNTVFILEDCEKSLVSRDIQYNPIINTILNITDGIIGDALGIKLICTFNTSLKKIDKALLRKGRLSMKYEFKKLNKEKVAKILGHPVDEDMTLADIYNIDEENDFSKTEKQKIGYV